MPTTATITTTATTSTTTTENNVERIQRICSVNEVFLLRKMSGEKQNETWQANVISLSCATRPSKASQISVLGVEPNPFLVSILHPRSCGMFRLCCASIGPVHTFRADILRAGLRVFQPRHCLAASWTRAVTWFWKCMQKSIGAKAARGNQWIDTDGFDFWVSMRNDLNKDLHGTETLAPDLVKGRTVLLEWLEDLLKRNYFPPPRFRHVLHTGRILDPGTLIPVFDKDLDEDGLRVLCGIETEATRDDRALVQCYNNLFDETGPLLHEAQDSTNGKAYTRLVDLRIARSYSIGDRTLYFSPYRIVPRSIEALCRPPCAIVDTGGLGDRPLDQLARLLTFPVEEYFLVYDSTVTDDSPLRRLLLAQFETSSQDLAAISTETEELPSKATMTERIRRVKSRVYRLTADDNPLVARCIKTVFLLDFAKWHLRQLHRLCSCFPASRFMSRARTAWVALNTDSSMTCTRSLDPTKWTRDTDIDCILYWFDVNFIVK